MHFVDKQLGFWAQTFTFKIIILFFIHLCSVRIKNTVCCDSHACALCELRFRSFVDKDSLFVLLFYFSFIYVLFTHSLVWVCSSPFSELIHIQQEVKLFGLAFSSPAIWSVIFQVQHFPGLAFLVAPPPHLESAPFIIYVAHQCNSCPYDFKSSNSSLCDIFACCVSRFT